MQLQASTSSSSLPPNVKVSELPDGVRYGLPRLPPHISDQASGVYLVLFGVLFLAAGILAFVGATWTVFFKPGGMDGFINGAPVAHDSPQYVWMVAAGCLFVILPFLGIGLSLSVHGIYVLVGRGNVEFIGIEVRDDRLHILKQLDFVQWRRSRPLEHVRRLEVQEGLPPSRDRPSWVTRSDVVEGNLLARCEDEKPLILAAGYPVAVL